jgi:hypothetical protein
MKCASTLAIVFMMLAAGATSWAQTTTGRLIGSAVDEAGPPLPGVVVTIASPALIGGAQTRVTDARGEYSFVGIAPGEYTVQAALSGFITQERAQVKVPSLARPRSQSRCPPATNGEIE